jgi:hypothetical protein
VTVGVKPIVVTYGCALALAENCRNSGEEGK